jgi:hypothetical protein
MAKAQKARQPFIEKKDRPAVKINLDTPLSDLHVRELSAILGFLVGKTGKHPNFEDKSPIKEFFDKPFPEEVKDWVKESKSEKLEKLEKEKNEKAEKNEKQEKGELKEIKAEKIEHDGVFEQVIPGKGDPRFEQMIQAVGGLAKQVSQLANQVEEIKKKIG